MYNFYILRKEPVTITSKSLLTESFHWFFSTQTCWGQKEDWESNSENMPMAEMHCSRSEWDHKKVSETWRKRFFWRQLWQWCWQTIIDDGELQEILPRILLKLNEIIHQCSKVLLSCFDPLIKNIILYKCNSKIWLVQVEMTIWVAVEWTAILNDSHSEQFL